jgi:hypothetical protein
MDKPQDVQKTSSQPPATPDLWRSFRDEFDRLFDRFTVAPWSFPTLRRTAPPATGNWFGTPTPVVDVAKGVLTVTLPKTASSKEAAKKIEVKPAS